MAEKPRARILNVDDDDAGRYVITKILTRAGYDVVEAATGRDALRLAGERPDLILLDVNLPDINGLKVCNRIKADPRTASIPVVHISATCVRSENRVVGLEGGADGYLVQPIDPQELVATVRAFLRLKGAEQALRESEEKYRLFLQNITGIAYQAVLQTFQPTFLHGTVEEISGYTASEFVAGGMTWDRIIHPEDLAATDEAWGRLLAVPGSSSQRRYRILRKDGEMRWIQEFVQSVP
ncbi:MAG: response regulator, partial [Chloroflexi bacterium]|nr:response regulator [Chloroflexota bacterium]